VAQPTGGGQGARAPTEMRLKFDPFGPYSYATPHTHTFIAHLWHLCSLNVLKVKQRRCDTEPLSYLFIASLGTQNYSIQK